MALRNHGCPQYSLLSVIFIFDWIDTAAHGIVSTAIPLQLHQLNMQNHACHLCLHYTTVSCVSVTMHKDPLPLQLDGLYLGHNFFQGPLPDSWSECVHVSHCLDSLHIC